MGISLKPAHLKRYGQLARLLARYGQSDLVRQAGLEGALEEEPVSPDAAPEAAQLTAELEAMGPTYVKLGQLLSTRVDLLPRPYTDALARLQDRVEPFPFAEVEEILREELGVRLSKAFQELDPEPMAAASLGQVHSARLRDGRRVAIKVQRPGIRPRVLEDLDALDELAGFLDEHTETGRRYDLGSLLAEMRRALLQELDYRQEALHLTTLRRNLEGFDALLVPAPVDDYCTTRVLTMEHVSGRKVTSISPLARLEVDGERLAEELFRAYLKQILVDGFFHADPHPGNVFLTDDGRLALLDVGLVGRLSDAMQDDLLRLLLAISEGRGEEAADLLVRMGEARPGFDADRFEELITSLVLRNRDASAEQLQIGRVMLEATRGATETGLRMPASLATLGRTLLHLDQVGRTLDPGFQPNAAVRRHASETMRQRMLRSASPQQMLSSLLEMNEFTQRLPGRLNRVLDAVADREMEVRIRVTNEAVMMEGLQKVANRITVGLVLAALIVGAAMLMRVETSFRILGYPALAMVLFLAAVVGGVLLVWSILAHDRHQGSDPPPR